MRLFSVDITLFHFFPHEKLKKTSSKVAKKYSFFIYSSELPKKKN